MDNTTNQQQPSLEQDRERLLPLIKSVRVDIDALIQRVDLNNSNAEIKLYSGFPAKNAAYSQSMALTRLIEAKMWMGKMLEGLGNPFPAELADKSK